MRVCGVGTRRGDEQASLCDGRPKFARNSLPHGASKMSKKTRRWLVAGLLMSFAGPTSAMAQRYIREILGSEKSRISMPTIFFGSRHDPMLANVEQMAQDLFERCELAIADEKRPFADHARPDEVTSYAPIVRFTSEQRA
jgi:hypothetical protein